MRFVGIIIIILLKIISTQSRFLPVNYVTMDENDEESTEPFHQSGEYIHEKVIGLKNYDDKDHDEFEYGIERNRNGRTKKPCAVVVLSNIQNPNMQSLLRKYRYDANGILIPSSVKYFIKMPQGLRASPLLVPLNDKAFSPLGGFVRYYKEVPPIPQSW
ncbi:uncharacterized protein LOC115446374 [Manduca sexta]|uniref:uncharacterized protein LOC115446374 n=1 Tax=Manduca sexta TaxID=7130 RepID=UPI001183A84A|nr:uncharacterized protein LOC115446374 [Manduca sexta]